MNISGLEILSGVKKKYANKKFYLEVIRLLEEKYQDVLLEEIENFSWRNWKWFGTLHDIDMDILAKDDLLGMDNSEIEDFFKKYYKDIFEIIDNYKFPTPLKTNPKVKLNIFEFVRYSLSIALNNIYFKSMKMFG